MKLKKIIGLSGLAIASVAVLAACSSNTKNESADAASEKKEVVFATSGATAPFAYQEDGELTGFDIEVAKAVFEGSDKYDVSFKKTEWSSIFTGLDSDKYQMAGVNISYTEERAAKYLYSYPTGATPSVLVVRNDSDITSYDEIGGHSTQVVQGTTSVAQLEKYNETAEKPVELKFTSENITQTLTNLSEGKADFKIFDAPTVNAIIKNQGLDNLKTIDLEASEQPYIYFLFGGDQTDLQEFVNGRIKELYEDGTIAKLAEEFLGSANYIPTAEDLVVPGN
ncbi:amino acid ABC transporter substrate-binding protein [Streptococcus henryi]|uniref:amino acid ABC transporter substrate-binding protein n=1 Tax=Streptococcus henryi TaxID=439219 RepID=UPI00036F0150|nr:amino acid ABC transporter substrate-binding protein [Streptococcus henryi]